MRGRESRARLERVARPLSETLLARSVELASQALLLLLVPRALGSADYGSFAAAFAAMSVVSIGFGLGAPLAAMRYVPGADPVERAGLARAVARHVAIGRARALAALTTLACLLALVVPGATAGLVATVCLAGWFSVGSSIAAELALALGRTRLWNARFVLENLLVVLAAIAGHALLGTTGAIVGLAFAAALTFVVLAAGDRSLLRGGAPGIGLPAGLGRFARLETASVLIVDGRPARQPGRDAAARCGDAAGRLRGDRDGRRRRGGGRRAEPRGREPAAARGPRTERTGAGGARGAT